MLTLSAKHPSPTHPVVKWLPWLSVRPRAATHIKRLADGSFTLHCYVACENKKSRRGTRTKSHRADHGKFRIYLRALARNPPQHERRRRIINSAHGEGHRKTHFCSRRLYLSLKRRLCGSCACVGRIWSLLLKRVPHSNRKWTQFVPVSTSKKQKRSLSQRTWAWSTSALANTFLSGFFNLKLFLHLFFVLTSESVPSPPPHPPLHPAPPTRLVSTPGTLLSGVISEAWERFHPTQRLPVVFAPLTHCFIKLWRSGMVWI